MKRTESEVTGPTSGRAFTRSAGPLDRKEEDTRAVANYPPPSARRGCRAGGDVQSDRREEHGTEQRCGSVLAERCRRLLPMRPSLALATASGRSCWRRRGSRGLFARGGCTDSHAEDHPPAGSGGCVRRRRRAPSRGHGTGCAHLVTLHPMCWMIRWMIRWRIPGFCSFRDDRLGVAQPTVSSKSSPIAPRTCRTQPATRCPRA